jgi:2-methylcitrate dehydratase PrpD
MGTLIATHAIKGSDVREVICEVTPTVAISLVHDRPATPQEAQFSLPFALGAILAHGTLGISSLRPQVLADPVLRREMAKVIMVRDDALHTDAAPEGAKVTIHLNDGRVISDYLGVPRGMPANPLGDTELSDKFRACCAVGGLDGADADRLHDHLWTIDTAASPLVAAPA